MHRKASAFFAPETGISDYSTYYIGEMTFREIARCLLAA
jgi:hypothetical protein